MPLEMSPKDLHTRGGLFDEILEKAFDGAIVLDANGIVLHNTKKSAHVGGTTQADSIGRHVSHVDAVSPFAEVLATGKAQLGILVVLNGRKCMTDVHPVIWKGEIIGAVGALLFHSMNRLKKIIASLNDNQDADSARIYNAVARIDANYTFSDFIGESAATQKLITHCRNVARKKVNPILILGETGTGKEILASGFHSEHLDSTFSPFVKINCTAIPNDLLESELFGHEKGAFTGAVSTKKGKFELASGGSILLDEIGDMDLRLQSKLLRVLEEGEYEHIGGTRILPLNARIIASTNHELKESCRTGKFRPDLYYRLSTAEIRVPPLRARREDIPLLVRHLIDRAHLSMSFTSGAMEVLMGYHWPGNVRELRNVLRWLSFLDSERDISPEDVIQVLADPMDTGIHIQGDALRVPSLGGAERAALLEALESNQFNLSMAAKRLGVSRTTLYSKIRKHGIQIRKSPV
ncbi:sigma-54-dependent Fis family transcriptional regulator [Geothrix sp. 21YS21S-2]|uniref:sigma-54 interaction domain-containing protein n=1 Tax=Geothrix sp. 21YS21S-2 TaxID=3068893 RepID=UPI0027BA8647|nr:sigma 54-interacting transcriptional regulator [Geothrix sp. 21YS21S-2]